MTSQVERNLSSAHCSKRIFELSLPKQSKRTWITDYETRYQWGNQETIRPMRKSTLQFVASDRIKRLSQPKPNHVSKEQASSATVRPGYKSSFWSPPTNDSAPSKEEIIRYHELMDDYLSKISAPKQFNDQFRPNRQLNSPEEQIWVVSEAATKCQDRPRTRELAQSRLRHKDYVSNKEPESQVSRSAIKCSASDRIRTLSREKPNRHHENGFFPETPPEKPIRHVSAGARSTSASPRLIELARARIVKEGHLGDREIIWPISKAARRANASTRVCELAAPLIREQAPRFDTSGLYVKPIALKAMCSERVAQLAQPIRR